MGKTLPAIHGKDHLPWGPDPIGLPGGIEVFGNEGYDETEVESVFFRRGLQVSGSSPNVTVDVNGKIDFTPTLTSAGGVAPTNFAIVGKYVRLNQVVFCEIRVLFSTVSVPTAGNGCWIISGIPAAATPNDALDYFGTAVIANGLTFTTPPLMRRLSPQRYSTVVPGGPTQFILNYPDPATEAITAFGNGAGAGGFPAGVLGGFSIDKGTALDIEMFWMTDQPSDADGWT